MSAKKTKIIVTNWSYNSKDLEKRRKELEAKGYDVTLVELTIGDFNDIPVVEIEHLYKKNDK